MRFFSIYLENPERPPPPPPPLPNPGSRPKSKEEVLPIRLDNLDVLELLGNPPLFDELLKLLKPKPFCWGGGCCCWGWKFCMIF